MSKTRERKRTGIIGENRVEEIVLAMPHDWLKQEENTPSIDGIISIFRKSAKTGWMIYVQVKTGPSYLKSETKTHYSIGIEPSETEYWNQSKIPVILIWCDTSDKKRPRLFWTHISRKTISKEGSRVYIPKNAKFGTHSSGDLYQLAQKYHDLRDRLPRIDNPKGPHIPVNAVKKASLQFYKEWQQETFVTPAYGEVKITRRGWRHLTAIWRTQRSAVSRLTLLGAAKIILASVATYTKCRETTEKLKDGQKRKRTFYIQTALVKFAHRADVVVSVVTERLERGPIAFYGVYEDWGRMPGGEGVHHG